MRLNRDKRYQIKALLNVGLLQKDIANQVGMTPGALSKELNRNGGRDKYDPDRADRRARKLARAEVKWSPWKECKLNCVIVEHSIAAQRL